MMGRLIARNSNNPLVRPRWRSVFARLAFAILATALLAGCDALLGAGGDSSGGSNTGGSPPPENGVRVQGRLSGLVETAGVEGASLSSAAVNVAALPVTSQGLDVEATESTEVSQEDGSFSVDVEPEENQEHVFLVEAPEEGVGVEQSLGFIELPVGEESSAGWDLSDSEEAVLNLGELSSGDGAFLAEESSAELLEALNADQQELLFQAQRDNYLKTAKNTHLNSDTPFDIGFIHTLPNDVPIDRWPTPEEAASVIEGANITVLFANPPLDLYEGIRDGTIPFRIEAPLDVTAPDGETVPRTIDRNYLNFPNPQAIDLTLPLAYIPGDWEVYLNDEKIAVYDWGVATPLNEEGQNIYFVPAWLIETDEDTGRIQTLTLRWYSFDPVTSDYVLLEVVQQELPLAGSFNVNLVSFGEDNPADAPAEPIDVVAGEPIPIESDFYVPPAPEGEQGLTWIHTSYNLGGVTLSFPHYLDYP